MQRHGRQIRTEGRLRRRPAAGCRAGAAWRLGVALIAVCLALAGPGPFAIVEDALAQKKVKDKRLRSRTSTENERRLEAIAWQLEEINALLLDARRLKRLARRLVRPENVAAQTNALLQDPGVIGYGHPILDAAFSEVFPGHAQTGDPHAHARHRSEALIRTYARLLQGVQVQMRSVQDGYDALRGLRLQIGRDASNELQALQLAAAAEVQRSEEMILLRQALALQTNVQAVLGAHRASKEAEERAVVLRGMGMPVPSAEDP